jgi:AbrB family transcriptional regulator (stage V sporulation protein T)
MEQRKPFHYTPGSTKVTAVEGQPKYQVSVAAPILAEGDVSGCVVILSAENSPPAGDTEVKLAQTVASFLGKQMES